MAEEAAMREWFEGLSEPEQEDWLDAVRSPDSVEKKLAESLPAGRHGVNHAPKPAWWVYAPSGSPVGGRPGTALEYRMVPEFREFLGDEHERRYGVRPTG